MHDVLDISEFEGAKSISTRPPVFESGDGDSHPAPHRTPHIHIRKEEIRNLDTPTAMCYFLPTCRLVDRVRRDITNNDKFKILPVVMVTSEDREKDMFWG